MVLGGLSQVLAKSCPALSAGRYSEGTYFLGVREYPQGAAAGLLRV